jgi:hypothetical protein
MVEFLCFIITHHLKQSKGTPEAKQGNWSQIHQKPLDLRELRVRKRKRVCVWCIANHHDTPIVLNNIKHEKFWWHPLKHGDFKSKNIYSTIQTYGRYDQPQLGISPKSILALPSSNVWFHCKRQKITIKYKKWCVRGLLNIRVCLTTVYLKIS